ncbi:hypothetical protein CGMCC3_g6013 [Colletotrichum fructicola]|nr:uncharacterized protein CGMCC3_g6013 [Colletotrichum fructicola]KAE9578186.1 hypothetical protein CGMCC3_g6013 [Colletotrichum fructicola]
MPSYARSRENWENIPSHSAAPLRWVAKRRVAKD